VAVLLGFEEKHAVLWRIFSCVAKQSAKFKLNGERTNSKALYNFHETVVEDLKAVLKEGLRTVVVAAPPRTTYTQDFLGHIKRHHRYLLYSKSPNQANFAELVGSADNSAKVVSLVKTKGFTELIAETTSREADQSVQSLERHLYGSNGDTIILYTLKEIEDAVCMLDKNRGSKNEYLLITTSILSEAKQKNRINRLLQIAVNKEVKTRVVDAETPAGNRINQFGGMLFFSAQNNQKSDR